MNEQTERVCVLKHKPTVKMPFEAAHLVAVLVFVPAPQHLQPLAGSLHLGVFLLSG